MTDVITAVLQLPALIAAAVTLEAGEIITAQIVQPAAPIAAAITVAGPAGPAGASGSAATAYPFTNAATWTVRHNLGRYPLVQLLDTLGAEFDADVESPDLNTTVVTHAQPLSGTALIS